MEAKTTRSSVFHTNYHIVFCPMYRRKVFKDDIAEYLEQFFKKQVEKKGWTLIAIKVRPDHIHLAIVGISPITRLSVVCQCVIVNGNERVRGILSTMVGIICARSIPAEF